MITAIKLADAEDLMMVLRWLLDEYKVHGAGFWSNAHLIVRDQALGRMWVLYDDRLNVPIGFHSPEILAVHWEWRGQGVGPALVAHLEELARQRGETELTVESLWQSISFWERQGYLKGPKPPGSNTTPMVKRLGG